jgi:hypothetical protein
MTTTVPASNDVTEERAALAAQLAAARQLYMTFDPDSPPWAIEGELERLEQVWRELTGEAFVDAERP